MLKENVLSILLQSDGFLSGESISRDLQVSRAAVNQAVKILRSEGYVIDSVTKRGYRLVSGPDRITPGSLQALLGEERMARVLCYESTDSTNRRLQEAALDGSAPNGLIAVANEQTAGRGRLGRSFSSPQDMGIYLSLLIRPGVFPAANLISAQAGIGRSQTPAANSPASAVSWTILTSWTAVAVSRAIEKVCNIRPEIKWVNDLLLDGRKICGILTQMELESESGSIRDIIIGIGVNVQESKKDFPEELQDIAGSLFMATGRKTDRSVLAAEMIRQLDRMCADWYKVYLGGAADSSASSEMSNPAGRDIAAGYLEEYRRHSLVIGTPVSVINARETKEAIAESIGDDFSLHVRYSDGSEEDLRGGEISVRKSSST